MGFSLCPQCGRKIIMASEPEIGDHIQCESCRIEVVVSWLNPIELLVIDNQDNGDPSYAESLDDSEFDIEDDDYYDESYVENFQKIKQPNRYKKGGYDANW